MIIKPNNRLAFKEWEQLDFFSIKLAKAIKADNKEDIVKNCDLIEEQIGNILSILVNGIKQGESLY